VDGQTQALARLDSYLGVADEILSLDVEIRQKLNEFDLQAEAVDEMGLTARSVETLVQVDVNLPQQSWLTSMIRNWPALAGLLVAYILAAARILSAGTQVISATFSAGKPSSTTTARSSRTGG
jgi:HAMP domain-containing protein